MEKRILLALIFSLVKVVTTEWVISTFNGKIGPGNYTYYTLNQKGKITLILESLVGDVDIYLSKDVERPNYLEYDLQSATCGLDIIPVPNAYPRPLHVALFGYARSIISEYKLTAIEDFSGVYEERSKERYTSKNEDGEDEQSFKSLLWTIILGILKIILEVVF